MDFASIWDQVAHNLRALPQSELMLAALAAMALGLLGSLVIRRVPALGRALRSVSTLGLMGVLLLVVLQLSRLDSRFDMAVPELGLPKQVVEGRETRVPLAPDGHYWLHATVNGAPVNFLLTGAYGPQRVGE